MLLSYQNSCGGWATYENTRSFPILEVGRLLPFSFYSLVYRAAAHGTDCRCPSAGIQPIQLDRLPLSLAQLVLCPLPNLISSGSSIPLILGRPAIPSHSHAWVRLQRGCMAWAEVHLACGSAQLLLHASPCTTCCVLCAGLDPPASTRGQSLPIPNKLSWCRLIPPAAGQPQRDLWRHCDRLLIRRVLQRCAVHAVCGVHAVCAVGCAQLVPCMLLFCSQTGAASWNEGAAAAYGMSWAKLKKKGPFSRLNGCSQAGLPQRQAGAAQLRALPSRAEREAAAALRAKRRHGCTAGGICQPDSLPTRQTAALHRPRPRSLHHRAVRVPGGIPGAPGGRGGARH